jgi:signal recognition particle GTPase
MMWHMRPSDGEFTLKDFINQMGQVQKLGSMSKLAGMIPGMSQMTRQVDMKEGDVERQMGRMKAIYYAMSGEERSHPELLDGSRRRRIADGAGVELSEVGQFMKQFEMSRDMMGAINGMREEGRSDLVAALATNEPAQRDPSWRLRTTPPAWLKVLGLVWPILAAVIALAAWRLFR